MTDAALVRPYTLTAGRTEATLTLPAEAAVSPGAGTADWPVDDARTRILALAPQRPSVAEIASRLQVPLAVARVLVGDLVHDGYLQMHTTLADVASLDERREVIGRTLRGLRAL